MTTTTNALELDASGEWADELAELQQRRQMAARMGGEEAVARHKARRRQTARERIDTLLDAGSFRELGRITGRGRYDEEGRLLDLQPVNAIIGTGRMEGRRIVVSADDYTIRAGSSEGTLSDKWIYAERLALAQHMPLVRLVDTAGGSVKLLMQQAAAKIPGYGNWPGVELLKTVPVVGVALGACAGLGAVKVLLSHFSVMVRDQAQVFAAGPPVVKQAYGIDVDKNDLGGYKVHRKSALVHNEAENEADALRQVRQFLSYLPASTHRLPARTTPTDDPARADDWLKNAIPHDRRKIYDPRRIMASLFDRDSVFEIGRWQGGSIITALARLDGWPVGVLCSDPKVAGGAMTLAAAYKTERHAKLCDTFGLPMVNLVDQPGNATGPEAELAGTLLGAVRVVQTIEDVRIPWLSVILRRAFGMAGGMHAPKYFPALNHRFAWPSARWGSIPIEGGVDAAHKAEIEAAADPAAARAALEARYHRIGSPFRTAEHFGILDIIDPRETRALLCDWMADARAVLENTRGARA
ncbi:acetyl-CoA carboxylase carboxyltransferase component [Pseudacidovorax intermedius]|uniref:Acetyl-CoA carboxylase carboxyltransferase component n=1 Tax=Pseudacidovorax intermedius TaxID=433924 RepID=A0A370FIR6_9BURK|nr:carboxyl transferase domain-containing protein [Pseudacidovorax intermedius]RDI24117.1 acetyl-CoA carboxylase carboxyltransferase component [Pseudacidovorax intermedius]